MKMAGAKICSGVSRKEVVLLLKRESSPFDWQWKGQARPLEPEVRNAAETAKNIWRSRPPQGKLDSPNNTAKGQGNGKEQMNKSYLSQHLPGEGRRPENSGFYWNVISSHCTLSLVPLVGAWSLSSYLLSDSWLPWNWNIILPCGTKTPRKSNFFLTC